jgi:molecular chaperone GrpE (heat shock protein)
MPKQLCPKHNIPLTYSRKHKRYFCKECLYASFLTHQAQQASYKKWHQSAKGKASVKKYEQTTGRAARERYLHSDKYKQRRREYNERLKESLRIARIALAERATREKEEERIRTTELAPLIQDIREYIDSLGRTPTSAEVTKWARDAYSLTLSKDRAQELITKALRRH